MAGQVHRVEGALAGLALLLRLEQRLAARRPRAELGERHVRRAPVARDDDAVGARVVLDPRLDPAVILTGADEPGGLVAGVTRARDAIVVVEPLLVARV